MYRYFNTSLLLCTFITCCSLQLNAQNKNVKGLSAKVGNTYWKSDINSCVAVWDNVEKTLTISATSFDQSENITIQLKSEGNRYSTGFSVGEYYFYRESRLLDNYSANAFYSKNSNGTNTQWKNNDQDERSIGKVQIIEITATNVRGSFSFDLEKKNTYSFDKSNVVSIAEGVFDIDFQSPGKPRKKEPFIGIYDIQMAPGINWMKTKKNLDLDGDFGSNYSLGFTVVNLSHSETSGSSSTVSIHYDYSRQNGEAPLGSWHFRRNELFARIKPFTNDPTYSSTYNGMGAILLSGLYADVGYTNGSYFYKNYLDEQQAPNYTQNGVVWGWGYNLTHRPDEKRWGMTVGYGSKIYNWKKANGDRAKYSSRTIWVGATYNFVWNDN